MPCLWCCVLLLTTTVWQGLGSAPQCTTLSVAPGRAYSCQHCNICFNSATRNCKWRRTRWPARQWRTPSARRRLLGIASRWTARNGPGRSALWPGWPWWRQFQIQDVRKYLPGFVCNTRISGPYGPFEILAPVGGWCTLLATFQFTWTNHQISKVSQIQISLHYHSKFWKNFLTFWDIFFFFIAPILEFLVSFSLIPFSHCLIHQVQIQKRWKQSKKRKTSQGWAKVVILPTDYYSYW